MKASRKVYLMTWSTIDNFFDHWDSSAATPIRDPAFPGRSWDTLRPAVFAGTRIRSGVSWFRWLSAEIFWHGSRVSGIYVTRASRGCPPPGSNPPLKSSVFCLVLEAPFCWGMLTRPESFLRKPGVSRIQSCARTHLKKGLCHTHPFGGARNKYMLHRWKKYMDHKGDYVEK